uniref:Si:ch1073-204b8.1 n=1 Tax=Scleropages formosus TaxID=113540 RepID=A0A8C9R019_SCLFO
QSPSSVCSRLVLESSGAWDTLCSGHHRNRVRGCDRFGCGAFNSKRGAGIHRAVDVVCDDYSVVNAPFSGTLGGPVYRKVADEYCVKIFNVRPYRYMGPISKGEAMGYLLPLQERFSGITSHLELQMCDRSNPFPYI